MLKVSKLTRRYGSFMAVDDVSFSIGKGDIVGLLGHNGAGKTTIMKMLSGYLEPNCGSITFDGVDQSTNLKKVQQKLGYLPENLPVYPEMIVADYLDYAAELKGLLNAKKQSEIARVINATDITTKILAPIATLSRGFKQRLGVAQAILGNPKFLILDEPTNGLDPMQTEHMRQLIRDIAQDATVILSTHIMQEVDALCSRVLIVNDGRLAVDARLEELHDSRHLLLTTNLLIEETRKHLKAIDEIETVTALNEHDKEKKAEKKDNTNLLHQYRLTLSESANVHQVSAIVAKTIINLNADLYQLSREHRDLETLFREVNARPIGNKKVGGLSNAA